MSPNCLVSHKILWNFIVSRSFHNFSNGLFKTMDVLQERDIIVELIGKELEDPQKKNKSHEVKNTIFKSLISKLWYYSNLTHSSVKANRFINSVMIANTSNVFFKDLLDFFSEENDSDGVNMIKKINSYENYLEDTTSVRAAMEVWKKGKISDSFSLFSDLYERGDLDLRKQIIRTLQGLVFYSIEKEGKSVVNSVVECSTRFSHDKNEFALLVCVWYSLFTSEMYEDRCRADAMLVADSCLQKYLEKYIPWLGYLFLKNNELTSYQRLIETALRYNMDSSVGLLLRNLFTYYYRAGYISGCSAVYKCCVDLDIKLTYNQLYKYQTLKSSDLKAKTKYLEIPLPEEMQYKF